MTRTYFLVCEVCETRAEHLTPGLLDGWSRLKLSVARGIPAEIDLTLCRRCTHAVRAAIGKVIRQEPIT
jgi:hypothetical protein